MANEFKRMQKLAGIITESQVNKKTIKSKRFLKENDENLLSQNDLNELEEAILDVYQDWLDLDDHADEGGYVWDTEYHGWVNLYDFVISMIYRGVNPSFLAKLESKIQNVKNDDGSQMDLTDYIETYHDDWIQNVEKAIREDIPAYFEDDEELNENKFYSRDYVKQKYGDKSKEIEINIEDEEDNNPNIWDLYTSLETAKETDDFIKGFINTESQLDEFKNTTKSKHSLKENTTAKKLFQTFKDEDLLNDRREYDVEDFMSAYPDLSKEEAEKLEKMLSSWAHNNEELNEGDTDYNRAKDTKRLGKKGEENIYGAGVKKGEEIEKKKMKMSELKAAIKELYLNESEDDININDDESLYDPVYENLSMRDKDKIEQIIQMLDSVDGETMEYILRQVGMEDQMANQLVHNRAEMSEAKKDKKDKKEDTDIDTDIDIDIDTPDNTLGNDIPTEVKAVQDALLQAQTAAERLNDEKLIDQIGNTITFFTRSHISEKPGITAESKKKHLNESVEFPEMDSEFEGAMETGDYDSPQDYLQYIIDTPSSKIDLSGYYDVEDSIMQGYYSKGQAIKLMKSWAKNKMNKLNKSL
jgi:hypothetical protein